MTNPMSIMARLKTETADLHTAAERSPLQRQLVKGDLSVNEQTCDMADLEHNDTLRIGEVLVRRVFPGYETFRERLRRFDPICRFDSSLRRRIGV